jgi:hypothetical protein
MKYLNSKSLKYLVYLVIVTFVILVAFNTILTLKIHKQLARIGSKHGRWPVGAYIYDPNIGFDFAAGISGPIGNGTFYVKSHQMGYRIGKDTDQVSWQPGGLLSLGCSFTYGDEVEADQTFTELAAEGLNIPAYNYGICSFSYTHAILKAQKLKDQGILSQLQPKYVVLGCWSGLPDRSKSPFPPLASGNIPLPAAYLTKDGNAVKVQYPMNIQGLFDLIESYRHDGTSLTFKRFAKIFFSAPKYFFLYMKNQSVAGKLKAGTFNKSLSEYEVYDFYFSAIERIFKEYNSKIIVLFMPNKPEEGPDTALKQAMAKHPDIIFANGLRGLHRNGVSILDYVGIHPAPAAHQAYSQEILTVIGR